MRFDTDGLVTNHISNWIRINVVDHNENLEQRYKSKFRMDACGVYYMAVLVGSSNR